MIRTIRHPTYSAANVSDKRCWEGAICQSGAAPKDFCGWKGRLADLIQKDWHYSGDIAARVSALDNVGRFVFIDTVVLQWNHIMWNSMKSTVQDKHPGSDRLQDDAVVYAGVMQWSYLYFFCKLKQARKKMVFETGGSPLLVQDVFWKVLVKFEISPGDDVDLIFYLRLSTARTERIQTQQHRPTCHMPLYFKKYDMHSLLLAFFCTFLLCSCFFAVVFSCDFAAWLCLHLVLFCRNCTIGTK